MKKPTQRGAHVTHNAARDEAMRVRVREILNRQLAGIDAVHHDGRKGSSYSIMIDWALGVAHCYPAIDVPLPEDTTP